MSISKSTYAEYASEYGSFWAIVILLLKYIRRTINRIYIFYLQRCAHVKDEVIVFSSTPDYSDNSKALSDYLVDNSYNKRYKIYWLVSDVDKYTDEHGNNKVTFIPRVINHTISEMPFRTIRICMTAKYVLSTHANRIPKSMSLKGQKYIYLWHGCGYKDNNKEVRNGNLFDLCLVPGPLFVKTKARFWNTGEEKFLPLGYPRYDWLKNPSTQAKTAYLNEKGENKKMLLWMPTYRNPSHGYVKESTITQFPLLRNRAEWKELDDFCIREGVKLLIKLHPLQKMYDIDFSIFTNVKIIPQDYFSSKAINMYEFIGLTDGLVSDYSSVAVDYLLVDKPIAFALDDYENYKESRGFVFDNPLDYMPGHHLYTFEDLKLFMTDVVLDKDDYREQRHNMMRVAMHSSVCYCKDIAEKIGL
jgi:CDP-glycerol glycerophosphotransferase (TagB/SpsB family)